MSKISQAKFTKFLLVFFAALFAAILIHPEWDLPEVHDVKITSVRHQSYCRAQRPIHPVVIDTAHSLMDFPSFVEWLPQSVSAATPSSNEPLLTVLRV